MHNCIYIELIIVNLNVTTIVYVISQRGPVICSSHVLVTIIYFIQEYFTGLPHLCYYLGHLWAPSCNTAGMKAEPTIRTYFFIGLEFPTLAISALVFLFSTMSTLAMQSSWGRMGWWYRLALATFLSSPHSC